MLKWNLYRDNFVSKEFFEGRNISINIRLNCLVHIIISTFDLNKLKINRISITVKIKKCNFP